ncbi:MAG TPA: GNAT family N-acetyltransferase [Vicinamibacterales bacterium]|nr:GNAT family N-acetyltransferase [Vicinamibacterales bacterium]
MDLITDYGAFLDLEAEWNEAVDRADIPHPFLRHEWVRTWWDCFGTGGRLHIVVVRAAGRIVAIAPLMRDTMRKYGISIRRLRFLQNDHTPRTDIIVTERAADAYRAIWKVLATDGDPWDVLQLGQLPRDSATRRALSELATAAGWSTGIWTSGDSPFLTLTGSWASYLASLSAKFRSNLRNRMSRLTKLGEPALEVLRDHGPIERACDDVWRLEASGWKREAGTAIASDPAVHRFYSLLAGRATARGWLRLLFLTVGGKRIATSYGACYHNRLFLFKTGYDPEYATCAPFKLLTYFAIQHAYAEGLTEVDFLGDAEPWKLEWTTTGRGQDWFYLFPDTRRARLLHWVKFQVVPELKRWRA